MASNGGKGSGRRPTQVDTQTADDNWERIFGMTVKQPETNVEEIVKSDQFKKISEDLNNN